jgi:glycosyltransferase involved in cell wall biosynthesis
MAQALKKVLTAAFARKSRQPFGVNVAGHFNSEKGVGEAVRSAIRILDAAQVPYVLNNFNDPGARNSDVTFTNFSDRNPYRFNLIVLGSDAVPYFASVRGQRYFQGHYNIGHWAWELTDFPIEWESSFGYFDEIWVASSFVQHALGEVAPVPVKTLPYAPEMEMPARPSHHMQFGLPRGTFVFLFVFDFHSYAERKNPLGLIEAFKRAFTRHDDVLLYLKASHSAWAPSDLRAIQEASKDAAIRITDRVFNREQIAALLSLADCYLSLHRAEGFGLTMAEAMLMGKPVIATGYSGNLHFMTAENSFLVGYRLVPIEKDHGPYQRGFVWADPDLDHAAALMRYIYEHREAASQVGARARQDILAMLTPEVLGRELRTRLERVGV